jgi:glycosyltransferase involved in cell wall biosynthesis
MTLVSYVIPCYNCEQYITECIDSVLLQSDVTLELILVDDGSCDSTISIIQNLIDRYPSVSISLYSHQGNLNKGVSSTRRLGVNLSSGDYICFLDADDYLIDPAKTSRQLNAFRTDPRLVMVHTAVSTISTSAINNNVSLNFEENYSYGAYSLASLSDFLSGNHICTSSVMIKRDALLSTCFDSPQCFQFEDWALWLLLSQHGRFLCLPDKTVAYRVHDNSATARVLQNNLRYLYSLLECKLIVLSRAGLSILSLRVLLSLRHDLRSLLRSYSISGESRQFLPRRNRVLSSSLVFILFPFTSFVAKSRRLFSR